MIINKIVRLGLESRAKELKEERKSEREIMEILNAESNNKLSQSCVHRYFAAEIKAHCDLSRHELIKEIRELSKQAKEDGDLRTAIAGLDKEVAALDSLDKRLGRFAPQHIAMKVEGEITHRIDIKAEVRKYITALELLPEEDIITVEAVRK